MKTRPIYPYIVLYGNRESCAATHHLSKESAIKSARRGLRAKGGDNKTAAIPGMAYERSPFMDPNESELPTYGLSLTNDDFRTAYKRVYPPMTQDERYERAAIKTRPVYGTLYRNGYPETDGGQGCLHFRDDPESGAKRRTLSGSFGRVELLDAAMGAPVFDISDLSVGEILRIGDLPMGERIAAYRAINCPEVNRHARG